MKRLLEQRYAIKLCVRLKKSATETFEMLQEAFGEDVMSRANAFKWYKQLKNGREDLQDSPREGRPSTSTTEIMANTVKVTP